MSNHTDYPFFEGGGSTYWDSEGDRTIPFPGGIGQAERWGPIFSGLGKGFLDQYLGKSTKYQNMAGSSFDTQKKAEDVAKGTAAGWGTHQLGSNFTALTPPVTGGGGAGQNQPFVVGGGQQQQAGGKSTVGRVAGSALSGLGTYGALALNPVTAPFAVVGGIASGIGSLFG